MSDGISLFYRHREILFAMVVQSIRDRIAGSVFGILFLVIYPLIFLGVYSTVFIHILQVRVPGMSAGAYTIVIFCGLVPFLAFAEAFSLGTSSVVSNANLVRNILFPYQLLPAKDVIASYASMLSGFAMLVAASIWEAGFSPFQLLLPIVLIFQILFTIGLVWITSVINVFLRDFQKIMPIITLFLLMVSPIAYTKEMLSPELAVVLSFNPVSFFIYAYRDILLNGLVPWTELGLIGLSTMVSLGLGYFITRRLRPLVFDFV